MTKQSKQILFLDELPNAETAPAWRDQDGHVHEPLGASGVNAVRDMIADRAIGNYSLPAIATVQNRR